MLAASMHKDTNGRAAALALAVAAGLVLLAGSAVYLLDRPAGSAWLVPPAWQAATDGRWFGAIGPWLPSFAHAFAFSVFTALVLPRRPGRAAAACVGWAAIDTLAEAGQHAAIAPALAAGLTSAFDGAPLAARIGRYFTQGSFDITDVLAGLAGSGVAYAALRRWWAPSETRFLFR